MALEFTQEEIEKELSDKLPHGKRREVAKVSGLGESYLKRQFNPDDETASSAFRTLQVVCALDEIDANLGEAFWQSLAKFRELSQKRKSTENVHCLNAETGKLGKEISDFVSAKLTEQSYEIQMTELLEAEEQLRIVKNRLIQERIEVMKTKGNQ